MSFLIAISRFLRFRNARTDTKINGFSLIEMLAVIAIAAILIALLVPSFENFLQQSREQTLHAKLLRAIQLARNEAITRDKKIILRKNAGDWKKGFVVLDDEEVLQNFSVSAVNGKLFWRASLQRDALEFFPSGFMKNENGTFWYCREKEKNPVWAIVINQSARVRTVYPDEAQEIVDDKGEVLECKRER